MRMASWETDPVNPQGVAFDGEVMLQSTLVPQKVLGGQIDKLSIKTYVFNIKRPHSVFL